MKWFYKLQSKIGITQYEAIALATVLGLFTLGYGIDVFKTGQTQVPPRAEFIRSAGMNLAPTTALVAPKPSTAEPSDSLALEAEPPSAPVKDSVAVASAVQEVPLLPMDEVLKAPKKKSEKKRYANSSCKFEYSGLGRIGDTTGCWASNSTKNSELPRQHKKIYGHLADYGCKRDWGKEVCRYETLFNALSSHLSYVLRREKAASPNGAAFCSVKTER